MGQPLDGVSDIQMYDFEHDIHSDWVTEVIVEILLREGLTKKKCEISNLGGKGSEQILVIFTLFYIFLPCPKSYKSAKNFFSMGEGNLLAERQKFLDIRKKP